MNHDDAWHLLPWFVNGSLRREVRNDVDAHLAACADCRSEVALQMKVRDSLSREDMRQESTQSSFDQLWARIEAHGATAADDDADLVDQPLAPAAKPRSLRAAAGMPRWLVAAVVVQAIGLVTLGWFTLNNSPRVDADYQTLSSPAPFAGTGQIRTVFAPDLQLRDLQTLLASSELTIIGGPTEAGVYTLASTGDKADIDAALAALRRNPAVRFAEPIGEPRSAEP
jgi:hypothetical protein